MTSRAFVFFSFSFVRITQLDETIPVESYAETVQISRDLLEEIPSSRRDTTLEVWKNLTQIAFRRAIHIEKAIDELSAIASGKAFGRRGGIREPERIHQCVQKVESQAFPVSSSFLWCRKSVVIQAYTSVRPTRLTPPLVFLLTIRTYLVHSSLMMCLYRHSKIISIFFLHHDWQRTRRTPLFF